MNRGTIFSKTEVGRAEISRRSNLVDAGQRRILILVDGKRTVNDLGAFARAGEVEAVLERLHGIGMVETAEFDVPLLPPVAPGFASPASSVEPPRAATNEEEFARVRALAADFVAAQLGSAGEPICDAIQRCSNPEALRRLFRGIEVFVGEKLDSETANSFARHFGKLLL